MRHSMALVASLTLLGLPATAFAQDEDEECPPGGWFCDEDADGEGGELDESDADPEPVPLPSDRGPSMTRSSPPQVVVYTPEGEPPPKVVVVQPTTKKPPPPKRRHQRRHGLNLRLEGVMMGDSQDKDSEAGMGGVGASYRFRPVPRFALDFGMDALGGTDWAGNRRQETALMVNGILYFNPQNPVQVYMLGGFGISGAEVEIEDDFGNVEDREYSYFGGQLGFGLEFRVSPLVSLNLDLMGFMRGRVDDAAHDEPEFTDPETGRTTNASGGGLFRGGITFYW
jgi:opacity protein-like surface antigen